MAVLCTSKEVNRGEYVVAKNTLKPSGIVEFTIIMQCTMDKAYELFAAAIFQKLRLEGDEGFLIVHPDDLTSGYWGFRGEPDKDNEE